jgi:hypothetical protein
VVVVDAEAAACGGARVLGRLRGGLAEFEGRPGEVVAGVDSVIVSLYPQIVVRVVSCFAAGVSRKLYRPQLLHPASVPD